ncbi:flavodoxin family protein [Nocardia sp. NPDC051463]|uniref:flavodoxin family protein n=1 Tax=Nocardia sp. NPDC051463 TaxID=3154845 RepID=UPI00342E390C
MRARVVYESMFGNTAAIAEAIADGLREHSEVEVLTVAAAAEKPEPTVDLLVVGGPTHAFGLSRARTRRDAATQTDAPVATDTGIREWLDAALPVPGGSRAAAFGTKAAKPSWLPGSAARGAGRRLRRLNYELADDPMDFYVEGTAGPLASGELPRARAWAEHLAHTELDRIAHRV